VLPRRPLCLLEAEYQQVQQELLAVAVEVLEVAGALLLVEALAVEVLEEAGALLLVEALAAEVLVVLAAVLLEAAGRPVEATAVSIRLAAAVSLATQTTSRPSWRTCGILSCRVNSVRQIQRRSWRTWR